jgi:hypothetical protein
VTLLRRLLGGALLLLSFAPFYLLLDTEHDPLRRAIVDVAGTTLELVQTGTLTAVLLGVLLAFLIPRTRVLPYLERLGGRLSSIPVSRWALGVALLAFLLAVVVNSAMYGGFYTNIDEISSIIHARYLAAGQLAGQLPGSAAGWLIPNMLTVDAGWVSQFPPSHLVLLASGVLLGVPQLVGPILFAVFAGFSTLALSRLIPAHQSSVRLTGLLVALSPFLVSFGAGGWSHTSAGAFLWLTLYAALRARDGSGGWSVLAGAAIGVAVCSRPWVSVLLGTLATLGTWLSYEWASARSDSIVETMRRMSWRWMGARVAGTLLGGAPFAIALGWYNRALFGSPTTLGYVSAFGTRHGLGFHQDPWGNPYAPLDAFALTSGDVIVFGTQLLETPIPVAAVIGIWLLLSRQLPKGAALLAAWAALPVGANALYWFHSTRMMYEAAPAWIALSVLALVPLFTGPVDPKPPLQTSGRRRLDPSGVGLWTAMVAVCMALLLGIPQRVGSLSWDAEALARLTVPALPNDEPALVFVHVSWNERLSARLQGSGGMRQDSVISLLRRNTNCTLDTYSVAREQVMMGQATDLPDIDLRQIAGTPADIVRPPVPDGTTLRTRQNERFSVACQRELNADRFGAVALAPLLWQGDLPGIEEGAPLFVRDLGPERNQPVVQHYSERNAWVLVPKEDGAQPELVPYAEAMQVLWGS